MEACYANNTRYSSLDPIASAWSTRRRDRWGPDGPVYHARHRYLPADGLLYPAVRYRGTAHRTANVVDLYEGWRLLLCSRPGAAGAAGPPAVGSVLGHALWPDRTWAVLWSAPGAMAGGATAVLHPPPGPASGIRDASSNLLASLIPLAGPPDRIDRKSTR